MAITTKEKATTYVRKLKVGDVFYDPADQRLWEVARTPVVINGATHVQIYLYPLKPAAVFRNRTTTEYFRDGIRARGYIYNVDSRIELV